MNADARRRAEEFKEHLAECSGEYCEWYGCRSIKQLIDDAVAQEVREEREAKDADIVLMAQERAQEVGRYVRLLDEARAEVKRLKEQRDGLQHTLDLWNKECGERSPRDLVADLARLRATLKEIVSCVYRDDRVRIAEEALRER